jgi:hypothetical protein
MQREFQTMQEGVTLGYRDVAQAIEHVSTAIENNSVTMRTFSVLPTTGHLAGLTEAAMDAGHSAIGRSGGASSGVSPVAAFAAAGVHSMIDTGPELTPRQLENVVTSVHHSQERIRGKTDPEQVADSMISTALLTTNNATLSAAALKSLVLERSLHLRSLLPPDEQAALPFFETDPNSMNIHSAREFISIITANDPVLMQAIKAVGANTTKRERRQTECRILLVALQRLINARNPATPVAAHGAVPTMSPAGGVSGTVLFPPTPGRTGRPSSAGSL